MTQYSDGSTETGLCPHPPGATGPGRASGRRPTGPAPIPRALCRPLMCRSFLPAMFEELGPGSSSHCPEWALSSARTPGCRLGPCRWRSDSRCGVFCLLLGSQAFPLITFIESSVLVADCPPRGLGKGRAGPEHALPEGPRKPGFLHQGSPRAEAFLRHLQCKGQSPSMTQEMRYHLHAVYLEDRKQPSSLPLTLLQPAAFAL